MTDRAADIVVAGHICLDIIPALPSHPEGLSQLLAPGKLVEIGPASLSTGGAVANTGLALRRLGFGARLMGKIGDDAFGRSIKECLDAYGAGASDGMIVSAGESSSYTIVISPPGIDRLFLHATGTNDTFAASDVSSEALAGTRLFHFGYPPLMRGMYERGGEELVRLLARAKEAGATVSLDMARPDPASDAGRADWPAILARALPHVDVFLPSLEEILFMLRPDTYRELSARSGGEELLGLADGALLSSLGEELLALGVAVAGIKLGEHGLYVRTAADAARLQAMGACAPGADAIGDWLGRELLAPCFAVDVEGTTGAGDCTIAGLLGGLASGLTLERSLLSAVGTGACNVERADAVSGIPRWEDLQRRIHAGWQQRTPVLALRGWTRLAESGLWSSAR
ncbi:Sugar or nucleoside kinase, ribokinase family [Cohnella sp. OV330]|uniref:carbohydrate kinase family protein n=1 Tax=Cohnella sp. OV330 TaxID=1855288 RepID=UPI0008EE0C92|nr:carbohydrate kinase family protein [Cohnella sp. OV330]SFB08375.1 Sugar or nucleoside kinase, ribokinase family [Cohnella sp. OV330]